MDVRIFRVITFEDIEIPGRDPAAQAAVSKTELPVGIAAERRDALVAPPAGDKEILAVTGDFYEGQKMEYDKTPLMMNGVLRILQSFLL